jgi:hypothetical protein
VRKNGGLYNCIKVQKTISSNISNWISITPFLQKNGFVISGREIVAEDVEGWLLSAKGECVVLTVGKFEAD